MYLGYRPFRHWVRSEWVRGQCKLLGLKPKVSFDNLMWEQMSARNSQNITQSQWAHSKWEPMLDQSVVHTRRHSLTRLYVLYVLLAAENIRVVLDLVCNTIISSPTLFVLTLFRPRPSNVRQRRPMWRYKRSTSSSTLTPYRERATAWATALTLHDEVDDDNDEMGHYLLVHPHSCSPVVKGIKPHPIKCDQF